MSENNPLPIDKCRLSGSRNLVSVLNLGVQQLTGVFPKSTDLPLTEGPLELVWCSDSGLLQLRHSFPADEMYGENYGYRSGLNQSMVDHLERKISKLLRLYPLRSGDIVLDIGSNDGTLLKSYPDGGFRRIGMDPTGAKFKRFYGDDLELVSDFFLAGRFLEKTGGKLAKTITSIAMFYDLDEPKAFVRYIALCLDPYGIWHFEQSYMPTMMRMNAYDTVCHEHVEYYSLQPVKSMLESEGLKILDVHMNSVNGGSFAVTAAHRDASLESNDAVVDWLLRQEERMGLHTPAPFRRFEERVFEHRKDLKDLIDSLNSDGKKVFGYGASTKGNVLLQFCGFTSNDIPCIAEVNEDKFGAFTPGSNIPIVSESEARAMDPDYFVVLPWHFKDSIIAREQEFLNQGGHFIFPLPEIEII